MDVLDGDFVLWSPNPSQDKIRRGNLGRSGHCIGGILLSLF